MDGKELIVISGPRSDPVHTVVQLNGVLPDERLTPKLARRAARVAIDGDSGCTVWDMKAGIGYRLYGRSARKLYTEQ